MLYTVHKDRSPLQLREGDSINGRHLVTEAQSASTKTAKTMMVRLAARGLYFHHLPRFAFTLDKFGKVCEYDLPELIDIWRPRADSLTASEVRP